MLTALIAGAPLMLVQLPTLPDLPQLPEIRRAPQVAYLDRTGAQIGARGGRVAAPVDLATLPAYVPAAVVAIEDRRFYEHQGFDPVGIARAVVTDLTRGRAAQGASTITQQLAKNLFLSQDQTVERKATELVYAVQLEQRFTKRQILGLYLSRVYYGQGAWGIEAAARRYFGHPASKLTLREAAVLAGVLKSPTGYNPVDEPERSDARSRLVLAAMVETGAITPAQRAKALTRPLKVLQRSPAQPAQYFLDWVDPQLRKMLSGPVREDLIVDTTLDLAMEAQAGEALRAAVARGQGIEQGALVALDGQGRVRALVGGIDYAKSQFNRAVQAKRQAGSAWKPFVYLAAMEAGRTPETPVIDEPLTINGWSPRNYTNTYLGPITLMTALDQSINTVAARLADEVGRDRVAGAARRLGVTSPINTDPAMALGTTGVSPLELATAYAAFSNSGLRVQPWAITRIRTAAGRVVWTAPQPNTPRVIANPALGEMTQMLRGVIASGTGVRAAIPRYDLAGKTGTTSDYRDAWFAGFTGGLTAVVWLGRDDAQPMKGVTGGGPPALAWRSFMLGALPKAGVGPIPAGPPAPFATPPPVPPPAPVPTDPIGELLGNTAGPR